MKVLTIRLTAPLQSYGNQSSFNYRSTNPYPTKSAVVGMISAALGFRRNDERVKKLNDLSFAVRIDQAGSTMTDFQIVEYDHKKHKKKLTHRDYLEDFVYAVAVGSEDDNLINKIEYALHHPKFQLYLGRRSNAPAGVLKTQLFSETTPLEVLKNQLPWQASKWYKKRLEGRHFEAELIADADLLPDNPSFTMKDVVGSFNQKHRYYMYREIAETRVQLVKGDDDEHDIMSFLP